jgi:long-subunit fatty acid transport protein
MNDKKVKVKQKGFGITPVLGFNYSPSDDWTFAAKYEFKTKLTLENDTEVDDLGMFPDGAETSSDIPAILSLGVGYRGLDWLEAQLSYINYFDKDVDFGNNLRYKTLGQEVHRDIDKNYYEISLGLQFNLSEKFAISVGGLRSKNGVTPEYQSDFSYSNSSYTLGGGIMWKITDKLTCDLGILNVFYEDDTVEFKDANVGNYIETYGKTTLNFAAGLSYSIF